jgi:hypothetical protein
MARFLMESKMAKIYLIIAIFFMVLGAYFMGTRIAIMKCAANMANTQTADMVNFMKLNRISDEKVFNTGVHDIRDILRNKYTIAD